MAPRGIVVLLAAGFAGVTVAGGLATAETPHQTVTLGSTTGTPSQNICFSGFNCTYVPFSNVSSPGMQVPFDGTVTSFSVNSNSSTNTVELRVLRPAGGGKYTGVRTSPPETLNLGVTTFTVSLPVKAGDIIGLDNDSSAIVFDTSSANPITAYYQPALADGATAAPNNNRTGYRLLLSATVQSTTTTTNTNTTTTTSTNVPPRISNASQSHRTWREGKKLASVSSVRAPIGTTFKFTLSNPAGVTMAFTQRLAGRRVAGRCVAMTRANRGRPTCTRSVARGGLAFSGHAGVNKVKFQGRLSRRRRLPLGRYKLAITAINTAQQRSNTASLAFTIVK